MSEMIERVARAICEAVFGPYESAEADRSDASISGQSRMAAIAAIEAMREPTRSMIEAGDIPELVNCHGGCMAVGANPDLAWRAMIDEALK